MSNLVARLGPERAAEVIDKAGGGRLSIPLELDNAAHLFAKFEHDTAVALVLHFGGEAPYIPRSEYGSAKLGTVVTMTRNGLSAAKIAKRLGCSDRTVYGKRAEARALGLLPQNG